VVAGWLVILAWGVNGAVVGMIAGALLLAVVFWRAYRLSPHLTGGDAHPEITAVPPG
jgi:hypothetical protein